MSAVVTRARDELGPDHEVAKLIAETETRVHTGIERVQDVFSSLLMAAGIGHMVDIVIHEIGAPLGRINRQLMVLEKELSARLAPADLQAVAPMLTSMKAWLEQIYSLRQRLEPQTAGRRGRAAAFRVQDEVEDILRLYESLLKRQGIRWEVVAPDGPIGVRMARSALGQIVANLIDNSIYWLIRDKGVGNGGHIRVQLSALSQGFRISVSDDGPGVAEEDRVRIFEPYFSRKPDGMGLGLYIARLVIEPYGRLVYSEGGATAGGACFDAIFERRVGRP